MNPEPINPYKSVEYLSPSAIAKWEDGVEAFYLHYLTHHRPPREPQTAPMAAGSAFDAYCKSYLHDKLFGKNHADSNRFDLKAIFEAQVDEHNRDEAWKAGAFCFEIYKQSGALTDLLSDLNAAQSSPRFEFEVRGQVNGYREGVDREMNNVVFLGKPDAAYVNKAGIHVVLDWKVNGYYSKYPTSPVKGYVRLRGPNGESWGCHKDCLPMETGGITVNINGFLEHNEKYWSRQLSIYAWLLGEPVGGDFILAVDQLSCKPSGAVGLPFIRIAEHRMRVSKDFQWQIFRRACEIWEIIQSGHIFRNLTLEESELYCSNLDKRAEFLYSGNDPEDQLFREMTR